jgi:hypothetical protein
MKIEETILTPADAITLLEKNGINRKLSRARVRVLSAAIERGEWQPDGNPIKLAEDGSVLDGQHRLTAVAEGKMSVPVIIIRGLPAESRLVVDSGKSRSFSDYLEMQGFPNSLNMASVVRSFWTYQNGLYDWHGDWFARPAPTTNQLWSLFKERQADFEEATSRAGSVIRKVRAARAPLGAGWLIFGDVQCERCGPGADDIEEFYDELAMSVVSANDNVTRYIKLMNRKDRTEAAVGRSAYSQTVQMALLIKTWNAFREGKPIVALRWRRRPSTPGDRPERFPIPH